MTLGAVQNRFYVVINQHRDHQGKYYEGEEQTSKYNYFCQQKINIVIADCWPGHI